MLKKIFAGIFAALLFTSCAVKKDMIRPVQEEPPVKVTVLTEPVHPAALVTGERSRETTLMTGGAAITIPNIAYKKYSALPGIDWNKQVQFSFKDEDIVKLFDFLTKASGLTIVNTGAEVSTDMPTDPQTLATLAARAAMTQPYYGGPQAQDKKDASKKIGPVSGNVTIYSKGSITLEQAFKILDSVLMGKGYCSLFVGDVLKVVPISGIRQFNMPVVVNNDPELATEGDEIVSQIIFLKNLTATKLRSDLSALIPIWGLVMSNEAANSLIVVNSLSNIKSLLKIIDNLEKASNKATGVSVFRLKYSDAKTISDVLNAVFLGITPATQQQQQQYYGNRGMLPPETEKITIVAETKSNSVVAVASPQTLALIKNSIEQLDQMQRQVLVEVLVVDVTLNAELQLGVEFNIDSAPLDFAGRQLDNSSGVLSSNLGLATKTPTFNYTLMQGNTRVFIHNLMAETKVEVKAAPRILTLDNQKAVVNVGQQVPSLTGSQTTSSGQVIYTYNYNTVGTILTVTPHINSDDFITMDVSQVVSKITQTTFFGAPVVDNRQASTSVRVKDGETMILGGIITDSISNIENKIPILGDIPLLGFLFKYQDQIKEKTELMLFLTPHIIDNSKQAGDVMKKLNTKVEEMNK